MGLRLYGLMIVWLCTGDLGCIFMGLEEGHGMIEDVLCVIIDTITVSIYRTSRKFGSSSLDTELLPDYHTAMLPPHPPAHIWPIQTVNISSYFAPSSLFSIHQAKT